MDPNRYYKYSDLGTIDSPKGDKEAFSTLNHHSSKLDGDRAQPTDADNASAHLDFENGAYASDLFVQESEMGDDPSELAYDLEQVPVRRPGTVLAAGFGNTLRAIVKAATVVEVAPLFTTGTDDKLRAFSFGNTTTAISLGKRFDEALFINEYAILQAAGTCNARTILWAQNTSPSDLLIAECASRDILLLVPMSGDRLYRHWIKPEMTANGHGLYDSRFADGVETKWRRCAHCGLHYDEAQVKANGWHCMNCGSLYRLTSDERIALTLDEGTFEEWDIHMDEVDPLDYPDFDAIIERAKDRSSYEEGVRTGQGSIKGQKAAVGIMEPSFIMGSMGSVVGEKLTRLFERATEENLPVVVFCASGGARMQEGLASLMQMAKVSAAIAKHSDAGLLYISVLSDPTTGGVTASFATLGDVILAEPGALIGFAGRRVIQDTIKQALPDDFQTSEFALEHGLIDAIVNRADMRDAVSRILAMHDSSDSFANGKRCQITRMIDPEGKLIPINQQSEDDSLRGDGMGDSAVSDGRIAEGPSAQAFMDGRSETADQGIAASAKNLVSGLAGLIDNLGKTVTNQVSNASLWYAVKNKGVADLPSIKPLDDKQTSSISNHAWESVKLARNTKRPTAKFYIDSLIDGFIEFHGDRLYGDDAAIIAGIGRLNGLPVTVIAEEKGSDLKSRIARNFGSPQPEGYRKAQRLMRQAQKFHRPIICFVDTQGAYCGKEAEERGMGNAIAESLELMATLEVPVVSVVLGEGGSGGALALAVANCVAMQENAVYSVLSPEGFASILWKDGSRAPEAASVMKMSAQDALEMGIIEDIIPEGHDAAHVNPDEAAAALWLYITNALDKLMGESPEDLRNGRYERFRKF